MSRAIKTGVGMVIAAILLFAISACGSGGTTSNASTGNASSSKAYSGTAAANKSFTVMMRGNQFDPADLTVSAGTTITWSNTDSVAHTVTATGGAFSSGNMDPGMNFEYTFGSTGTYEYTCTIHPSMKGKVTVTE